MRSVRVRKLFTLALTVVLIVTLLAGCGSTPNKPGTPGTGSGDASKQPSQEPIKVGVIQPLSGNLAFDGKNAVNGAKIAEAQVNAKGGINGRKLQLVIEDSAGDPAQAANAAEKLITKEKVAALVGAFSSSSTGAVMPVAQKYQIPLVTGISTSPKLTEEGNKWFFREVGTSRLFAKAFAKKIMDELKIKKVAYIFENGDWGRSSVDEFSKAIAELGGTNLTQQVINANDTDLYTQLTQIKNANPDAIYAVSNTTNAVRIAKQAKELGIKAPIFGEGSWSADTYLKLAGADAEGIYAVVEYVPTVDNPLNKSFVEDYKKAYGVQPDKYAAQIYTVVNTVAEAIKKAGAPEPARIRDALAQTDYNGVTGNIKFDEKGQAYGFDMYLVKIAGGKPQLVLSTKIEKGGVLK